MVGQHLASFEGRYPKDLFNKSVYTDDNQVLVGYVAKEIGNMIVVFSEFNKKVRFDIPKSDIIVAGSMVIVQNSQYELSKYKVKRDAPFPDIKDLKPPVKNTHSMEAAKVEKAGIEEERTVKSLDLRPDKQANTEPISGLPSLKIKEPSNPPTANFRATDRKVQQATEEGPASPVKIIQTSPISRQSTVNIAPAIPPLREPLNQKQEYTGTTTKPIAGTGIAALNHESEKHLYTTISDSAKEASPINGEVTGTHPATSDQQIEKNPIPVEQVNEVRQSAIEPDEDKEIQQINPQIEYNTDSILSNNIETASTKTDESKPSKALDVIEGDRDSISTIHDRQKAGFNEVSKDLSSSYYSNPLISMSRWQLSWMDLYNEFARSFANLSLNWFDFYCKLWLLTGNADEQRSS